MFLHPRYLTAISCPIPIEAKMIAAGIIEDINGDSTNDPNMSDDESL
jgi:hypothetical protein